jgi:hypothetical protein
MDAAVAQLVVFAAQSLMLSIYFRFPRNNGHRQTCGRFDPVGNDPKQTSAVMHERKLALLYLLP